MAPKIDRRNLRPIKVHEGEPISLDVKVSGEPAPDVAWSLNGKIVSSGNGLKCMYICCFFILIIIKRTLFEDAVAQWHNCVTIDCCGIS